jgi:hypothetical protein
MVSAFTAGNLAVGAVVAGVGTGLVICVAAGGSGAGAFIAVVTGLGPAFGAIRSGALVALAGAAGLVSDCGLDSAPIGTR